VNIKERLGVNVQRLRRAKSLSQDKLALEAGIHRTYIPGIEAGKRNPSIEVVEKLAIALDVSPGSLLDR
jgi:transcriptional regulator with XRE-family HTH domain